MTDAYLRLPSNTDEYWWLLTTTDDRQLTTEDCLLMTTKTDDWKWQLMTDHCVLKTKFKMQPNFVITKPNCHTYILANFTNKPHFAMRYDKSAILLASHDGQVGNLCFYVNFAYSKALSMTSMPSHVSK